MVKKAVTTTAELTSTGFIRETTKQSRKGFSIEQLDILDPYPDAYKVWMRKIAMKKRGKKSKVLTVSFLIARPMDGHRPSGGYDVIYPDREEKHFEMFSDAKHEVFVACEKWIDEHIEGEGFF